MNLKRLFYFMKNREIKFRLHDKEGAVIGYENHIVNEFGCWQILQTSLRGDFLDTDTMNVREGFFMAATYKYQFTGLKDKNGKDIHEGDIVKTDFKKDGSHESIQVIEFYEGSFGSRNKDDHFRIPALFSGRAIEGMKINYYEVIGNIHENPELLNS